MKFKYLIFLLAIIVIVGAVSASAPFFGTTQKNTEIELKQTCAINGTFCDLCNISSVDSPNGTRLVNDVTMTKRSGDFNYSLNSSFTSYLGRYKVNGYCDFGSDVRKTWVYYFDVTASGKPVTISDGILYISMLVLLVFFFVLSIIVAERIPKRDNIDTEGIVISVNNLKIFRPILFGFAWLMILAILFTASNLSLSYLGDQMFGQLIFKIFIIAGWMTIPVSLIWFLILLNRILRDKETKKLLNRGIDVNSGRF